MKLIGKNVVLIPAKEADRKKIFTWLTQSDVTSSMFGLPYYPDHPIPTWEEFRLDYTSDFFNTSGEGKGRKMENYIQNPISHQDWNPEMGDFFSKRVYEEDRNFEKNK